MNCWMSQELSPGSTQPSRSSQGARLRPNETDASRMEAQTQTLMGVSQGRVEMPRTRWRAWRCDEKRLLRRRNGVWAHTSDRQRLMKKTVSALYWTMTMHLVHPQSLHHHSPAQMSPPDNMTSLRALSSRGRGEAMQAATTYILTRANVDALGASKGDKDPRNRPKMAQYTLEQVPGCLRRRVKETSPGKA